jgi:hypothetical protein
MPDLPTITVNQAQTQRLLAAFAGPNGTQAEAVANYKEWLKQSLLQHVVDHERRLLEEQQRLEMDEVDTQVRQELTDISPPPLDPAAPPPPDIPRPRPIPRAPSRGDIKAF